MVSQRNGFETHRKCVQCAWYQSREVVGSVRYRIAQVSLDNMTSLEFEGLTRTQEPQDRILRALYDGPNGLRWKEFGHRDNNVVYHESVVRKDEEPTEFELIIAVVVSNSLPVSCYQMLRVSIKSRVVPGQNSGSSVTETNMV